MAIRRHLLAAAVCAALFALCVWCCAIASTAPASPLGNVAATHVSSPGKQPSGHARKHCAKPASFHSTGKPTGTSHKRRASCRRHHHHGATHQGRPPASGACTHTVLRPSSANIVLVRAATLCLVNRERTSRGEKALKNDRPLQRAAQGHSQSMAAGDYFDHNGQAGDTPLSRMRAAGYIFSSHLGYEVGENIGWGTLWLASPKAIVAGWMASPEHRANILDATFRETGIGVSPHPLASLARGQAGAIYTQDFGRLIRP
jgi:uncharacterized protein YkwD